MGQSVLVGRLDEGVDTVVDVLLDGVVDTALARWRPCAVVVDAQSAAAVNELHAVAHLMQLNIELRGFAQRRLNAAYLRNLAADMEVDELQTFAHALLVEHFECFEQFGTRQSELRGVAAALFPLAAAAGG